MSLGDAAEFRAPDSDVGIRVEPTLGIPSQRLDGPATLVLQISAERCPDTNHCEPALISDLKPYTGS